MARLSRADLCGRDGGRALALVAGLVLANGCAWLWAFVAFRDTPVLLGTALLAYGLGLRHAVDADHIAAIDNVTRKLMQDGQRPVGVGLFFSLGHSTVVVAASACVALAAHAMQGHLAAARAIGGVLGTLVSTAFLLAIAAMNAVILLGVWRAFRHMRGGGQAVEAESLSQMLSGGGVMARVMRPLFRAISQSWHMYPLGFLFGLGFDTASEVGLLGISADQAGHGLRLAALLVFPALFTAGMSLADTVDSVLMLGAYGWAFVQPLRKLYYNLALTLISVLAAVLVGGMEAFGLIGSRFDLHGVVWAGIGALNTHFGIVGYLIVAVFLVSWGGAVLLARLRGSEA
jgi:high-affinity nickel-transport protein